MATEQSTASTEQRGAGMEWASWIAALIGLWVLVSPFVLTGSITGGTPYWSNIISGIVVLVLAAYTAYTIRGT